MQSTIAQGGLEQSDLFPPGPGFVSCSRPPAKAKAPAPAGWGARSAQDRSGLGAFSGWGVIRGKEKGKGPGAWAGPGGGLGPPCGLWLVELLGLLYIGQKTKAGRLD